MANTPAAPAAAEPAAGQLTRRELAGVLGVHMQTVTKWERDGMPIAERGRKGKPSTYSEPAVRAWLQQREEAARAAAAGDGPILDLAQERARKERWQGLLAEQTFKAREKELLPRVEVEKLWSAEVAAVRAKLLALPTTLADRLHRAATLEGVLGVERILHEAVRETLRELADPLRQPSDELTQEPKAKAPRRRAKKKSAKKKTRARAGARS